MDKELLPQLRQLTLDETSADGVDNPLLDVLGGNAQCGGNGGVGERARGCRRSERSQSQQTQLVLQSITGISQHTAGNRRKRGSRDERLVGIERVRGEDLEQFEERAVAGAEGLYGVGCSQGSEVENGRVLEGGGKSADGQFAGFLGRSLVGGDGLKGLKDVGLGEFVVTSGLGGFGHGQVQLLGVLLAEFPGGQPVGQLVGQLRLKSLEGVDGAGLADDGNKGQQDVVPAGVRGGEGVEHGGEDGDGERGTVLRGAGDGFGEVGADTGKEHARVGGLVDEVKEKVVGRSDFCSVSFILFFLAPL